MRMKKFLTQVTLCCVAIFGVLVLSHRDVDAAVTWKDGKNPTNKTDMICEAQSGTCTDWNTEPHTGCYCRVAPKTCNGSVISNDFYTCLDGGAGGLFGSCKVGQTRGWGRCITYSSKSCTQYAKFYCVEVDVYYNANCSGNIVCEYQLGRADTCDPMAP